MKREVIHCLVPRSGGRYVDATIGGGGHGVNLHVAGRDLVATLGAEVADVTRDGSG
jgi:16S rRNA C1402 N4-methylase RsmH